MRSTHGLLAGLGAAGMLMAGALSAFLATAAVIGFSGWPGASDTPVATQRIAVAVEDRADDAPRAGRVRETMVVRAAAPSRRSGATRLRVARRDRRAGSMRATRGEGALTRAWVTGGATEQHPSATAENEAPRSGDRLREAGETGGRTIQQVTDELAVDVGRAAPSSGATLEQVGRGLADMVGELGDALGQTVDGPAHSR